MAGFCVGAPVLLSALASALSGAADPLVLHAGREAGVLIAPSTWGHHPLVWQADHNVSEPWRWWGAAWVHLSEAHRTMNLAGWFAVMAFGWAARVPYRLALAWLLAWPLTHVLLMLTPGLQFYAGLSGVLHAGVAVAVVCLCRSEATVAERRIGAAVAVGLVLKVLLEQPWRAAAVRMPGGVGLMVVPAAHACGVVAGAACALLLRRFARR